MYLLFPRYTRRALSFVTRICVVCAVPHRSRTQLSRSNFTGLSLGVADTGDLLGEDLAEASALGRAQDFTRACFSPRPEPKPRFLAAGLYHRRKSFSHGRIGPIFTPQHF